MNSKERLVAALHGQPVDYLPFSPFLAYVWESFPKAVQDAGQLAFLQRVGATPLWRGAPCPVRAMPPEMEWRSWVNGRHSYTQVTTPVGSLRWMHTRSTQGNTDFLVEHPLKTPEDFAIRTWIEEHTRYEVDLSTANAHFAANGREGLSIGMLIPRGKSAYQDMVEHLVGTEELAYAQVDHPDAVHTLYEAMVANDLKAMKLASETGAYEYWLTWEDSSTQNYSPRQYKRFIASEISQWCDVLHDNGQYYIQHACGHLKHLLKPMKDSGVFAVESISPPPTGNISIADARTLVGDGFGIIGGIEPTQFLNLSMEELPAYTEQVITEAQGGPFILANSDSCPPGVTEEKFTLVADYARQHPTQYVS